MLLFNGCNAHLNRLVNRGVGWNGYPSLTSKFYIVLVVAMAMQTLCLGSPVDSVLIWSDQEVVFMRGVVEDLRDGEEQTLEAAQRDDPDLCSIRPWLEVGAVVPRLQEILLEGETVKALWHQRDLLFMDSGLICRRTPGGIRQLIVPKSLRQEFMAKSHTGITGGHLGVRRTRLQVRRRAYWVGWSTDVKRFCRQCAQCCQYYRGSPPKKGPLQPIPCGEPWERFERGYHRSASSEWQRAYLHFNYDGQVLQIR